MVLGGKVYGDNAHQCSLPHWPFLAAGDVVAGQITVETGSGSYTLLSLSFGKPGLIHLHEFGLGWAGNRQLASGSSGRLEPGAPQGSGVGLNVAPLLSSLLASLGQNQRNRYAEVQSSVPKEGEETVRGRS